MMSARVDYVKSINDTASENASTTQPEAPVAYIEDATFPAWR